MFDHVYVLAEGHCVYQGSNANTVPYLASLGLQCPQYHSAADYLLDVANGEFGNFTYQLAKAAIGEQWRTSTSTVYIRDEYDNQSDRTEDEISNNSDEKRISVYTKSSEDSSALKAGIRITPSEWIRLWVLISRCNVLLFRDWTVTHLKLFLHVLCAIVIGFYFGDSGINANKSISNIGFLIINVVYLWYVENICVINQHILKSLLFTGIQRWCRQFWDSQPKYQYWEKKSSTTGINCARTTSQR